MMQNWYSPYGCQFQHSGHWVSRYYLSLEKYWCPRKRKKKLTLYMNEIKLKVVTLNFKSVEVDLEKPHQVLANSLLSCRWQTPSVIWWALTFLPGPGQGKWRMCSAPWTSTGTGWSPWRSLSSSARVLTSFLPIWRSCHENELLVLISFKA